MNHALWPVGPVGKPTEFHVFPTLAMTYTKYPQACKALIAFICSGGSVQQVAGGVGWLSDHPLNARHQSGVDGRSQEHDLRKRLGSRTIRPAQAPSARSGGGAGRFHRRGHVLFAPAARTPRCNQDRRTAGGGSIAETGRWWPGPSLGSSSPLLQRTRHACDKSGHDALKDHPMTDVALQNPAARAHRLGSAQGQP